MDVKVYQCVIQNVFAIYYTVLTESNSTEKITIPYVDYGRFEVFAEPGFSFEIVQDEVKLKPYLEKFEREIPIQLMDFSKVGLVLASPIDRPKIPNLNSMSKRFYKDPMIQISFLMDVEFLNKQLGTRLIREYELNSFTRMDILTSVIPIPEKKFRTVIGFLKTIIFRNYLIDTGKITGEPKINLKWGK